MEKTSTASPNPHLPARAAQYVRMSTEHQQYSPENQLEVIRQYAASHGMEIVQAYSDHGRSGLKVQLGKFGRYRTNVWNYPGANSFSRSDSEGNLLALHPTPKPVALIVDAIKDCTARGDLVLDPFLGSGTAVIATERSGRRCYGLELDPLYVDTIISSMAMADKARSSPRGDRRDVQQQGQRKE
jgi:hypothetical protein